MDKLISQVPQCISTNGQSRTSIHYHPYQKSWTRSKLLEPNISPNLMSDGDSTMYASRTVTNGKQHSRPTSDYMNQWSCSLDYAIPLWHFKQWWTTPSKMNSKRDFVSYTWMTSSFLPRTKKILNASPNAFSKASEKLTSTSNHRNANFAKQRSNTLALLLKKARWWWTPWNSTDLWLANPQTSTFFPWIWKLLSMLHSEIL